MLTYEFLPGAQFHEPRGGGAGAVPRAADIRGVDERNDGRSVGERGGTPRAAEPGHRARRRAAGRELRRKEGGVRRTAGAVRPEPAENGEPAVEEHQGERADDAADGRPRSRAAADAARQVEEPGAAGTGGGGDGQADGNACGKR